jgi:hypothetical protein
MGSFYFGNAPSVLPVIGGTEGVRVDHATRALVSSPATSRKRDGADGWSLCAKARMTSISRMRD